MKFLSKNYMRIAEKALDKCHRSVPRQRYINVWGKFFRNLKSSQEVPCEDESDTTIA